MTTKTLIGKNNYLFLQNDTTFEIKQHCSIQSLVNPCYLINSYEKIIDKFLLIIIPDKSYVLQKYLPDNYQLLYRPTFDAYSNYLGNHLLDGYESFKLFDDLYYKTDTHINNNGAMIIYYEFINKINQLFSIGICNKKNFICVKHDVVSLNSLGLGKGDLTWNSNLNGQLLYSISDTYYSIVNSEQYYMKYLFTNDSMLRTLKITEHDLIDNTIDNVNKILDWCIISEYILYKKNINCCNKYKIVIFYDSNLCSTLHLYLNLFYEAYCVKSKFNIVTINLLQPNYVFQFSIERFLNV